MEIFKQQNPFDIKILSADGTFLGVLEFASVKELCKHLRHNNLPDGQVFCLAGLDLRGGYLRQARLAGADLSNCNLEDVCLSEPRRCDPRWRKSQRRIAQSRLSSRRKSEGN